MGDLTFKPGNLTAGVNSRNARRLHPFDGFDGFDVFYLVSPHVRAGGIAPSRSAILSLYGSDVKSVKPVNSPPLSAVPALTIPASNRVKPDVKRGTVDV